LRSHVGRAAAIGALLALCLSAGGVPAAIADDEPEDQSALVADNQAQTVEDYAEFHDVSTTEAAAEIADRDAVDEALGAFDRDVFGGVYFTHDGGYTLHIVRAQGHDAGTIELPETPALDVLYEAGSYTYNELLELQGSITAYEGVVWTAPNETTGQVDAYVLTDEQAAALSAEFGKAVNVSLGEAPENLSCTDESSCDIPRGGLRIWPDDNNGELCTSGFIGKSVGGGFIKMLTVGHCGNETWDVGGTAGWTIGTTQLNCNSVLACNPGGGAALNYDVEKVGCGSVQCPTPRNCVYWQSASNRCYVITGVKGDTTIHVGDTVYLDGATTEGQNGGFAVTDDVNAVNSQWYSCGGCSYNVGFQVSHQMQAGDSGGPVFMNNKAWGMMSNSGPGTGAVNMIYADTAEFYVDVSICLSSSC